MEANSMTVLKGNEWFVYLETKPGSDIFRRRGPVTEKDAPENFASMMNRSGLRAFCCRPDDLGQEVSMQVVRRMQETEAEVRWLGVLKDKTGKTTERVSDSGEFAPAKPKPGFFKRMFGGS